MAKKMTQEELEQDPLLTSYARIQEFYVNNKNVIIGSAVVVLLAIGLAIGYHYYQKSQNTKAEQLMGQAEDHYLRGDYDQALNGSDRDLTVGFSQIIDNYSGTKAGNLAHYYAAVSAFNLGHTKQALQYMKDFSVPDGILGVAPLSFRGVLLTDSNRPKQAAEAYLNAAQWDENESTTPYNYLEAATAYQEAGDAENAKKYAKKVIDDYPDSPQATDAKKLLGHLLTANE